MIDVTHTIKAGRNIIGIDAATTMVNCFGPNRRVGVKEELFSAQQNFPDMNRFADNYELFDFGLDSVAIYVCDSDSIELCPA